MRSASSRRKSPPHDSAAYRQRLIRRVVFPAEIALICGPCFPIPFIQPASSFYDGWCHVGCPIGALANPLVTYLADARKSGAEMRAMSTVTRILTNQAGTAVP